MQIDFVAIGEPMLEFNQAPPGADGRTYFLEGYGGDTSNATIAAARQGVRTKALSGAARVARYRPAASGSNRV